jgi:hypothetical protein
MAEFASKGVAGTGLGLGIAGTAMSLANGGLGNLLGGVFGNNNLSEAVLLSSLGRCGCNESIAATRYDLGIMEKLSEKDSIISGLKSSQETDRKVLELFRYVDAKDKATGEAIAQIAAAQAVTNQKLADDMRFMEANLHNAIEVEKNARCCNDNNIVNYVNQTFYAKLVAGVTPTTETTAQFTYNPLNRCCGCNG